MHYEHRKEVLTFNRELLNLVSTDKAPFIFAGAGVSQNSDLPSWRQLIQNCVDLAYSKNISLEDLANAHNVPEDSVWLIEFSLQKYLKENSNLNDQDFFRIALWGADEKKLKMVKPTVLHYLLIKYASLLNVPIITTNYDDLFEIAADELNLKPKVHINSEKNASKKKLIRYGFSIVYLHGRIPKPTVNQALQKSSKPLRNVTGFFSYYDEFNRNDNSTLDYFIKTLNKRSCLFVGTSMTDHNINRALYKNKDNKKIQHFWFCRSKEANRFWRNDHEEFWKILNIKPIYSIMSGYAEIPLTFRRIINNLDFRVQSLNQGKKEKLFETITSLFTEFSKNKVSSRLVGAFDKIEYDFYSDNSDKNNISVERIWTSSAGTYTEFKKKKLNKRSFQIPMQIGKALTDDFISHELIAVEQSIDALTVFSGLRKEGVFYQDSKGNDAFRSWGFICFPIFSKGTMRAGGVFVVKFVNKNNRLSDEMSGRGKNEILNHKYSRDIILLESLVRDAFSLLY